MSGGHLLVSAGDILCVIGFLVATVFVLLTPSSERAFPRSAKTALAVAMGLYVFVGVSNLLE